MISIKQSSAARRETGDRILAWTVFVLVVFGLLMLSSASGPSAYAKFGDPFWFVKHQILFGLIPGAVALFFFLRFPYRHLQKLAFPLLIVSIVLLLLVFIPGIGAKWGTSRSWISIFGYSLQPSEIVKLTFLIYLAAWLEKRGEDVRDVSFGLLPFLLVIGTVSALLLLEPDMGGMAVIIGTALVVYFLAGAPFKHLTLVVGGGLGVLLLLISMVPYRVARFTTFLNPSLDPRGIGYHVNQALLAIGSGGIFGLGFGNSRQKFLYLPEVEGDSIFAVMAEEIGFILTLVFLFAILFFAHRGLKIARSAPDRFGQLLAGGIVAWFIIQYFVNIGGLLSLLPLTGLTLPFISYGGTSLFVSLAAIGILLNISRNMHSSAFAHP
ncbi:putative lipid II flippase FtsW [Patescibacteria group bacterium]|nr:MAG: putative lipid II flippase FtsW [Patescibacteria group bacterium]